MTILPSEIDELPLDAESDWDVLATALNSLGIVHVAPHQSSFGDERLSATDLFERLWRTDEPRLHQSTIPLLLTHPHLAVDARSAIDRLTGDARDRAMRRYVAAAAFQVMARTRIGLRLGPQASIAPAYLDDLGLPPLAGEFGRLTLLKLAEDEAERYGYDAWKTYCALLDLFLAEIRRRDWGTTCEHRPIAPN